MHNLCFIREYPYLQHRVKEGQRMSCIFFHAWGTWEQIPGVCKEQSMCTKCGITKERDIDHQFSKWNLMSDDNCTFRRTCTRCQYSETKTNHSFDDLHYAAKNSCTKIQRCQRCHYTKIEYHQHEFTAWQPINDISCTLFRICERCGIVEHSHTKHIWLYSSDSEEPIPSENCATYTTCLNRAIELIEHKVKKIGKILDTLNLEDNQRRQYIEQSSELELKILKYKSELQSADCNVLGDICTRCFEVINWGITSDDIQWSEYE